MLAALIGDLVFLPAILAGPAGRVFRRNGEDDNEDDGEVYRIQSTPALASTGCATAFSATSNGIRVGRRARMISPSWFSRFPSLL